MAKIDITESQAMELINNGYALKDIQIKEKLRICSYTDFNKGIIIEECVINEHNKLWSLTSTKSLLEFENRVY